MLIVHAGETEFSAWITKVNVYPTTMHLQPYRDADWCVNESTSEYVSRMRQDLLHHSPDEVLREWPRHADFMEDDAFLDFENFELTIIR